MSNTVITNYTDLNGPSTKTDSSVVVIVNKDGSLSVDQKLLGTLMGSDGSQAAGISVVRVGHEGRPDDATDSENEDDKVPHVTLSVDSYYDEPDSIIKYDSGAEMLQSLRIETRENSLIGFHNDHCYTPLTSPSQTLPQKSESYSTYDDPIIEITHQPPPKPVTTPKKISILDQKILPKGKKIILTPAEPAVVLKGAEALNKPLPVLSKTKLQNIEKKQDKGDEQSESSSVSSSGESAPDRDSDSDYKDTKDRSLPQKLRKPIKKPRILKNALINKAAKFDQRAGPRIKGGKNILRKDVKEKLQSKNIILPKKQQEVDIPEAKDVLSTPTAVHTGAITDANKLTPKPTPKAIKKEKKTPAHVSALLSDMTSLFSTPDVIRRVSTENKPPAKEPNQPVKKQNELKPSESTSERALEVAKALENMETKTPASNKGVVKKIINVADKVKTYDPIPQLDDASLAQILQDTTPNKVNPSITAANVINSPGLAGPLSPTLDLLAGLQPEEDGLTEDLLMHVAQLVESSENLQEVLDKQVLGKVDAIPKVTQQPHSFAQTQQIQTPTQSQNTMQGQQQVYNQTPAKAKTMLPQKSPIEIIRRDGRVITLPPIEAPATRSSKRKSQVEPHVTETPPVAVQQPIPAPEPVPQQMSKQYTNKKLTKKPEQPVQPPVVEKSAESQESWNSEDDPYRLWCICKQPHNNRFMICCDGCEDWFHGKCVNITKAMGQQMEEQGIEWRCPKCVKKAKTPAKVPTVQKTIDTSPQLAGREGKASCIVCKKAARASSIYCSDACILKHAQDSLAKPDPTPGKPEKSGESRVIVYERKSGRLLAGPNAPTAENLKSWLQKNPTFEVVRPGTLSAIKPNLIRKKNQDTNKIQTTLNFAKIPRKNEPSPAPKTPQEQKKLDYNQPEYKSAEREKPKSLLSPREQAKLAFTPKGTLKLATNREELKTTPQPKTPTTPRPAQNYPETPKSSLNRSSSDLRKNKSATKAQTPAEKANAVPQQTSRRKDSQDKKKMDSEEEIRENVRKSLLEQITLRMAENEGTKLTEDEMQQYANDTEAEMFEYFNHDVGMKYKAKYRSLMFNIKDRKNLQLWRKICEGKLKPSELVRLSPEEMASQELAQWREEESKHQLELIKKSEIDLLAASKTYVLKTHKGEEVMETKESVSTELDPNVPVEEIVTALNEAVGDGPPPPIDNEDEASKSKDTKKKSSSSRKRDKDKKSSHSKKDKDNKRDSEKRKSRSSRSAVEREHRSTRSSKKSSRSRSESKERKEKSDTERSRHRSRSRGKSKKRSRERSRSESRGRDRRSESRGRDRSGSRESKRRRSTRKSTTDDKHRSRSQENIKNKNDSTDSESLERPKSAMMKDIHPEYDPHEPMITSAFSEDEMNKSREDIDEDMYKNDISEYGSVPIDSIKSFTVDTNIPLPATIYKEKPVEVESDQEPSSTVETAAATVWNGCINMVDVARFYVAAHEVSGNAIDLEDDLTAELDIVGRINPDTVWDYIGKMKRTSNKDIVILRLQAANDEERMQYIALYSYLSSRNRLGVVKVTNTATVKDFYILPLSANTPLPPVLLPLDGPGLGEVKTHLLIAIIIRQRRKRHAHLPKDIIPAKVARESRKKSYTPPLSPRNRAMPLPSYTSSALSSTVKDKIAASLAAADDDEPYSPGSSNSSSGPPVTALPTYTLRNKMEELNRQIEEQKQQIFKMAQADSSVHNADDEAYSPSRPLSPAPRVPLSDIALPSNLHEILATIKQRETSDVDMRTMPMP